MTSSREGCEVVVVWGRQGREGSEVRRILLSDGRKDDNVDEVKN